jgi:heptosyltransferase-1
VKLYFFTQDDFNKIESYLSKERKNIIFIVGSTWESRNYPVEKFIELANRFDGNILIPYGNTQELEDANKIAQNSKNVKVVDKLNLNELKALISSVDLVIGGDTGPTYIAWANLVKTILLFGPTPKNRVYENSKTIAIESNSKVDVYKLNRDDFSIKSIAVDEVYSKARGLLDGR